MNIILSDDFPQPSPGDGSFRVENTFEGNILLFISPGTDTEYVVSNINRIPTMSKVREVAELVLDSGITYDGQTLLAGQIQPWENTDQVDMRMPFKATTQSF